MANDIPALDSNKIKHGLLFQLTVNTTTYYLSNLYSSVVFDGNAYTQLGPFLGMGDIQGDLKATNNQVSINLSGITSELAGETNFLSLVLTSNVKGSRLKIYRCFFNTDTDQIDTSAVYLRFNGYVSNYSLNENWDQDARTSTNTVTLQCSSVNAIMEKSYSGRRTNNTDQQFWYSGDTGMYRVKEISETNFDFGKPYTAPASASAPSTPTESY